HRKIESFVSEKSFPIGFVPRRGLWWARKSFETGDGEVIHDLRACTREVRDCSFKQLDDARVGAILKFEYLAQDTDARALQPGLLEKGGVGRRNSRFCSHRSRIGRISSHDYIEKPRRIFDRARDGACRVALAVKRSHA